MEVGSAVADVRSNSAEVWLATKSPTGAQSAVAGAVGLQTRQVTVHVVRGGARSAGGSTPTRPSRPPRCPGDRPAGEADVDPQRRMRHGRTRPRSHHQIRATYAAANVVSYEHRMASVEVDFRHGLGDAGRRGLRHPVGSRVLPAQRGALQLRPGGQTLRGASATCPPPPGDRSTTRRPAPSRKSWSTSWPAAWAKTSLSSGWNCSRPTPKAVLKKVASAGSWGQPMAPGTAQGLGFHAEYRSLAACLVEIDCTTSAPR